MSVNTEVSFDKSQFQGFWIAVRNGIDISIGRIGDKIISPIANFSDVMREGPSDPYYFGLTVSETTKADFGVNCDMPGLHFDDTCVTNDDCSEFPNTGNARFRDSRVWIFKYIQLDGFSLCLGASQ